MKLAPVEVEILLFCSLKNKRLGTENGKPSLKKASCDASNQSKHRAINLTTLNLRLLAGKTYLCTNYRIYEQ
ncbi:hypothetical protein GCM10011518_06700 [Flavobacterium limi]|uniref:Uncharacterized protein n=1 Tax=Flavobacterium limi TaxID=2045105 RepID=A0ABQ1TNK5_9FLAO|nr:hypothetical protein GCM10011518_06700 [Flavobacterium limi]